MDNYYGEHNFLEELLAIRSESWESSDPTGIYNEAFYNNAWSSNLDSFVENSVSIPPPNLASFEGFYSLPIIDHQTKNLNFTSFSEFYNTHFGDELLSPPELIDTPPFPCQDQDLSIMDDDEDHHDQGLLGNCLQNSNFEVRAAAPCKVELQEQQPFHINSAETGVPLFNTGICPAERKNKSKKINGQPSKNLMAERRRRKRLNDRLSMLRSVVPKISKMDRTSILGDTIDYVKELLERINNLQEEKDMGSNQPRLMSIFKDVKPNEVLVRNSPKFDVERRKNDTRIEICCSGKPGLLLSTLTTLEALGQEIQQCVISCFNDFTVQASCSEELEQREILSTEDIKQALLRNAGYGGRCI
ncbi:hypothetical protein ACH5RR_034831 [Cinchona calisaya]|uniref:BHLH domain-containing protein n=1 Tax=Cinchona calisaya TaxID=153742 RepID=A0ABD2YFM6_9GENT